MFGNNNLFAVKGRVSPGTPPSDFLGLGAMHAGIAALSLGGNGGGGRGGGGRGGRGGMGSGGMGGGMGSGGFGGQAGCFSPSSPPSGLFVFGATLPPGVSRRAAPFSFGAPDRQQGRRRGPKQRSSSSLLDKRAQRMPHGTSFFNGTRFFNGSTPTHTSLGNMIPHLHGPGQFQPQPPPAFGAAFGGGGAAAGGGGFGGGLTGVFSVGWSWKAKHIGGRRIYKRRKVKARRRAKR